MDNTQALGKLKRLCGLFGVATFGNDCAYRWASKHERLTILDIEPGKGIGPILLGMQPRDVRAVFKKRQQYEDWMGGNLNGAMFYRGLILHFDACNSRAPLGTARLIEIIVHRRNDATLFGHAIKKWKRSRLIVRLEELSLSPKSTVGTDLIVPGMEMGFDDTNRLDFVRIYEGRFRESWRSEDYGTPI